jgi:hypothetical protein
MTKEKPSAAQTETTADAERGLGTQAFTEAALIEALADSRLRKIPPEFRDLYDMLHKPSTLQSYAGIRFASEKIQAETYEQRTPYDKGFLEALGASTELENDGLILKTVSVRSKSDLIKELAKVIADQVRIEHNIISGIDPLLLEGKRAGFEWVLGYSGPDLPERYLEHTTRAI